MIKRIAAIFLLMLTCHALSAQDAVDGHIITLSKDTVACKILNAKKRKDQQRLNYTNLQIVDSLGNVKQIAPKEIEGYIKEGEFYKSLYTKDFSCFMLLITDGNVSLYFYPGYDMPAGEKYIFKKRNEQEYNIMNASLEVTRPSGFSVAAMTNASRLATIPLIDREKPFLNYFTEYFKDCPLLVRKMRSQWYTSSDIVQIFKDYNTEKACGK
jgi:hypothetical protein